MTRFWASSRDQFLLSRGVATGLTMEFQFGTNWSLYSNHVGDIFGAAGDGSVTGLFESTFVGLFFSAGKG